MAACHRAAGWQVLVFLQRRQFIERKGVCLGWLFPMPERPCSLYVGTGNVPGAVGMPHNRVARGMVQTVKVLLGLFGEGAGKCSGEEPNKLWSLNHRTDGLQYLG